MIFKTIFEINSKLHIVNHAPFVARQYENKWFLLIEGGTSFSRRNYSSFSVNYPMNVMQLRNRKSEIFRRRMKMDDSIPCTAASLFTWSSTPILRDVKTVCQSTEDFEIRCVNRYSDEACCNTINQGKNAMVQIFIHASMQTKTTIMISVTSSEAAKRNERLVHPNFLRHL
ncbi:hypothetical protein SCHPADRAFT_435288 [Schizopora paradoxa]|uniref:Uncharacterized protein n=1 Tax=Schizopora paradoxa TaxID=27342 RepID=A0A0H2RJT4_9AGAM|nr:hypothetical protein SCHPADRAFT_435288 [Schizopora paradoxa]